VASCEEKRVHPKDDDSVVVRRTTLIEALRWCEGDINDFGDLMLVTDRTKLADAIDDMRKVLGMRKLRRKRETSA
jgi:hypothetical protein